MVSGSHITICLVSYSVAPDTQDPVQLQQSVAALRYLLSDVGKGPDDA